MLMVNRASAMPTYYAMDDGDGDEDFQLIEDPTPKTGSFVIVGMVTLAAMSVLLFLGGQLLQLSPLPVAVSTTHLPGYHPPDFQPSHIHPSSVSPPHESITPTSTTTTVVMYTSDHMLYDNPTTSPSDPASKELDSMLSDIVTFVRIVIFGNLISLALRFWRNRLPMFYITFALVFMAVGVKMWFFAKGIRRAIFGPRTRRGIAPPLASAAPSPPEVVAPRPVFLSEADRPVVERPRSRVIVGTPLPMSEPDLRVQSGIFAGRPYRDVLTNRSYSNFLVSLANPSPPIRAVVSYIAFRRDHARASNEPVP